MTTRTLTATLALAMAISGLSAAPVSAGPITTLGECYTAVLNWCEKEFPGRDCSQSSGLDECDEVFGTAANAGKRFKLHLPGTPRRSLAVIVPGASKLRVHGGSSDGGWAGGASGGSSAGGGGSSIPPSAPAPGGPIRIGASTLAPIAPSAAPPVPTPPVPTPVSSPPIPSPRP